MVAQKGAQQAAASCGTVPRSKMNTRWDKWFSEDNLVQDPRILAAPPSQGAERAAQVFLTRGKRLILDLACGVGRDTLYLASRGLDVVGVDASLNGLRVAQRRVEGDARPRWVAADARHLSFKAGSFQGVYCFGLLHEFTGERWQEDVRQVMDEIERLLDDKGVLVLAVLAGEPEDGLPAVQLYTRQMFEQATAGLRAIEVEGYDDVGCTGRADYRVWYGVFEKQRGGQKCHSTSCSWPMLGMPTGTSTEVRSTPGNIIYSLWSCATKRRRSRSPERSLTPKISTLYFFAQVSRTRTWPNWFKRWVVGLASPSRVAMGRAIGFPLRQDKERIVPKADRTNGELDHSCLSRSPSFLARTRVSSARSMVVWIETQARSYCRVHKESHMQKIVTTL
jgi:SAM-dependent methyltransferase